MAGSAKFASEEMKAFCQQRAETVAGGQEGPTGALESAAGWIPDPLPCEAWGLWAASGYLLAAKSADGMNGWYFTAESEELPAYPQGVYAAVNNNGDPINVEGEAAGMAAFIANSQPYFFINGERFTQTADRSPEGTDYFVNCSGSQGRGCLCHFDTAGNGVAIYFFSSGKPVGTDERMGVAKTLPDFDSPPVDSRALPGLINAYTGSAAVHWLAAQ